MDTQSDTTKGQAGSQRQAALTVDGVSLDLSRQPVTTFLGKLDTVGDGLSILGDLLEALHSDTPESHPPDAAPVPAVRQTGSPELPHKASHHAAVCQPHLDVLKHHQDLFSLLRRIAKREIEKEPPTAPSLTAVDYPTLPPLTQTAAPTLFLGKFNVPPVDPCYRRLAQR